MVRSGRGISCAGRYRLSPKRSARENGALPRRLRLRCMVIDVDAIRVLMVFLNHWLAKDSDRLYDERQSLETKRFENSADADRANAARQQRGQLREVSAAQT
jgi:hypothetical protein